MTNMNISINDMQIITNTNQLNYNKLKVGDQILLIEQECNEDSQLNYNNLTSMIVNSNELNIISFQQDSMIYDIRKLENDDNIDANVNTDSSRYDKLLIGNKVIDTIAMKYIIDNEFDDNTNKIISKFKKNIQSFENLDYCSTTDKYDDHKKEFDYLYHTPIADNVYLCYICQHKIISEYTWTKHESVYIINPNENYYYLLKNINIKRLIDCLTEQNNNSNYFNKFKNACKIFSYTINDYLANESILFEIISFYLDVYFISYDDIEKFFKPIYSNDNFKAYFNSIYNNRTFACKLHYVHELRYNSPELELYSRLAVNIKNFMLGKSLIDPYTGNILDDKQSTCIETFRTSEHLIIKQNRTSDKYYYYLHNNIFVEANNLEIKEILEIQNTINTLCE